MEEQEGEQGGEVENQQNTLEEQQIALAIEVRLLSIDPLSLIDNI